MISCIDKSYFFYLIMLVSVLVLFHPRAAIAARNSALLTGNLLIHSTATDFAKGFLDGTVIGGREPGTIELAQAGGQYISSGVYTAALVKTAPFQEMVISWNSATPAGTAITIEGQVCVDNTWSEWFSWGTWSTAAETGSAAINPRNGDISLETDTLTIKSKKRATAFRYRLTLTSDHSQVTPVVRMVAVSIRDRQNIPKVYPPNPAAADYAHLTKDLAVPMYAQTVRDPVIRSRICSPTSLTMVMRYYGLEKVPEETAWGVMDYVGDMFGNWSFNTAYAASNGLTAYVDFFNSLADLKREIAHGHPVIASVKYRNSAQVPEIYPVLHNAPIKSTDGHWVVVRGFIQKNGKEYVLVNDPAAPDNNSVYREYLAGEFEKAWVKVVYVVTPSQGRSVMLPRISAQAAAVGQVQADENGCYQAFELKTADLSNILSPANVRSIIMQKPDGKEEYLPAKNEVVKFNVQNPAGKYKFIVIGRNHQVYEALLDWSG